MKKKIQRIQKNQNHQHSRDVEERFLEQIVTQMERADARREQRKEEFRNGKQAGARATTYQFSY